MSFGISFWMFVVIDIIAGVVGVIEPIILIFRRKIKVAAAKRRGLYECEFIPDSGIVDVKFLPLKNGKIEYDNRVWTVPPKAQYQTKADAMPRLILPYRLDHALTVGEDAPQITSHAQKTVASALEFISTAQLNKKDIKTFLLVIVIVVSIIAVALAAMAYNNTSVLTSPGFTHLIAAANPAS